MKERSLLLGLLGREVDGQKIEAFIKAFSLACACTLNIPLSLTEVTQLEDFLEFGGGDGVGEILFVGVDEESGILEVVVAEGVFEFSSSFLDTGAVGAVDNVDDAVSVLVVVAPERTEASLTTDVETLELEVLVFDSVDVEADCGDCGLSFAELELTKDSGLTGGV